MTRRLVAVLGPTAGGKSALAMELASRFPCEIVNCDSRQIYRGMDIGTAKPSQAERRAVPHHLFDIADPSEEYSAGAYSRAARTCIEELWQRNKVPLLVGGTGFYYQALMEGVPETVSDAALRERILERLSDEGLPVLVDELRRLDPVGAAATDTANPRRVCRALEIVLGTGQTLAQARARRDGFEAQALVVIASPARETLVQRIDLRVEQMLQAGLEAEVRHLVETWGWQAPGLRSIGYSEWQPFPESELERQQVKLNIQLHTRQFAKRQMTWFRHQIAGLTVQPEAPDSVAAVFREVKTFLEPSG